MKDRRESELCQQLEELRSMARRAHSYRTQRALAVDISAIEGELRELDDARAVARTMSSAATITGVNTRRMQGTAVEITFKDAYGVERKVTQSDPYTFIDSFGVKK